jgi:hypothetical protein
MTAGGRGGTYWRAGESACRRLQSVINFVQTSCHYMRVEEAVLLRRHADTPTCCPSRRSF